MICSEINNIEACMSCENDDGFDCWINLYHRQLNRGEYGNYDIKTQIVYILRTPKTFNHSMAHLRECLRQYFPEHLEFFDKINLLRE